MNRKIIVLLTLTLFLLIPTSSASVVIARYTVSGYDIKPVFFPKGEAGDLFRISLDFSSEPIDIYVLPVEEYNSMRIGYWLDQTNFSICIKNVTEGEWVWTQPTNGSWVLIISNNFNYDVWGMLSIAKRVEEKEESYLYKLGNNEWFQLIIFGLIFLGFFILFRIWLKKRKAGLKRDLELGIKDGKQSSDFFLRIFNRHHGWIMPCSIFYGLIVLSFYIFSTRINKWNPFAHILLLTFSFISGFLIIYLNIYYFKDRKDLREKKKFKIVKISNAK